MGSSQMENDMSEEESDKIAKKYPNIFLQKDKKIIEEEIKIVKKQKSVNRKLLTSLPRSLYPKHQRC